jgi:hypothetical protein
MKNPPNPVPEEDALPTFDRQHKIMQMFSDNAKTYVQLSSAALAVTLTFTREVLHLSADMAASKPLIVMWCCFVLAILAGAFYQFLAVKYLERTLTWEYDKTWEWLNPGSIYAVMLLSFYSGTILFTVYAVSHLTK